VAITSDPNFTEASTANKRVFFSLNILAASQ